MTDVLLILLTGVVCMLVVGILALRELWRAPTQPVPNRRMTTADIERLARQGRLVRAPGTKRV